ncbi:DUF488 family protein [Oleisolibacter albus]|uniref:DUF488 domain-containing protein n=1 Tax=Oleisolibacter albus TaxID=2171757 RepID=UPI000DF1241D|nr:DUF488 domain-containing protein [Oleisolibacter albus]
MDLFTIGYEGASQAAVLAALRRAGVRTLIDVRDLPLSRRAGFSKTPLAAGLAGAGIAYVHLKGLGTPKEGRVANHQGDWPLFWRIVEDSLSRPEGEHDLARAGALAAEAPSCLLCFEASHTHCHRLRVAELLAGRQGFSVTHLSPDAGF